MPRNASGRWTGFPLVIMCLACIVVRSVQTDRVATTGGTPDARRAGASTAS
jgi:hypothetical protein